MTHVDPSKLVVGAPVVTSDATVTIDASVTNPVDPGDHLFQLIVVDENGVESIPYRLRRGRCSRVPTAPGESSRTRSSRRGTRAGGATTRRTKAAPSRSPNTSQDRILRRCFSRAWSSRPRCRPRAGVRSALRGRWWWTTEVGGLYTPLPRSPGGSVCDAVHRWGGSG